MGVPGVGFSCQMETGTDLTMGRAGAPSNWVPRAHATTSVLSQKPLTGSFYPCFTDGVKAGGGDSPKGLCCDGRLL